MKEKRRKGEEGGRFYASHEVFTMHPPQVFRISICGSYRGRGRGERFIRKEEKKKKGKREMRDDPISLSFSPASLRSTLQYKLAPSTDTKVWTEDN